MFGDISNPLDYVDATGMFSDPYIQPSTNTASIGSTSGGSDLSSWLGFATNAMKLAPNLISAVQGNSYGQAGAYGQQGGGQGGFNLTGQSILGGGSLGISSSTLMLIAVGVLVVFMMKK
jgi:hypothetical protein